MTRVLVVEDEPMVLRRLVRLTGEAMPEAMIESADSVSGAVPVLLAGGVDLMLLDLNLRGEDGFQLLKGGPHGPAAVIVVSAHPERAVEGFDHEIVDFVAKPFTEERLRAALDRALARLKNLPSRTLAVRVRHGWRFAPLADIDHVRAADDYCELVLANGERLLHAVTLERLARQLPAAFVRIHRGVIVRRDQIVTLRRRSSGGHEALMRSGEALPVGRSFLAGLRT